MPPIDPKTLKTGDFVRLGSDQFGFVIQAFLGEYVDVLVLSFENMRFNIKQYKDNRFVPNILGHKSCVDVLHCLNIRNVWEVYKDKEAFVEALLERLEKTVSPDKETGGVNLSYTKDSIH